MFGRACGRGEGAGAAGPCGSAAQYQRGAAGARIRRGRAPHEGRAKIANFGCVLQGVSACAFFAYRPNAKLRKLEVQHALVVGAKGVLVACVGPKVWAPAAAENQKLHSSETVAEVNEVAEVLLWKSQSDGVFFGME